MSTATRRGLSEDVVGPHETRTQELSRSPYPTSVRTHRSDHVDRPAIAAAIADSPAAVSLSCRRAPPRAFNLR